MKFKIIIGILIVFLLGGTASYLFFHNENSDTSIATPKMNNSDTSNSDTSIATSKMNNLDTSNYELLVDRIQNEFNMEGYKEILGGNGDIVVVPDIIDGRQDLEDGFYQRNTKFVYKNAENGMTIILSVSASEERDGRLWNHSISYTEKKYNSETGVYKETYNTIFSDSEVSIYGFSGNGYSLSIVGISSNPDNVDVFTLSQTAQFLQELEKYLN